MASKRGENPKPHKESSKKRESSEKHTKSSRSKSRKK